jgi:hypothetical protein
MEVRSRTFLLVPSKWEFGIYQNGHTCRWLLHKSSPSSSESNERPHWGATVAAVSLYKQVSVCVCTTGLSDREKGCKIYWKNISIPLFLLPLARWNILVSLSSEQKYVVLSSLVSYQWPQWRNSNYGDEHHTHSAAQASTRHHGSLDSRPVSFVGAQWHAAPFWYCYQHHCIDKWQWNEQ